MVIFRSKIGLFSPETGRFEQFELFDLGRSLYYQTMGVEACPSYDMYRPMIKEKLEEAEKSRPAMDENLSELSYRMIHPDETLRAQLFSELNDLVTIY